VRRPAVRDCGNRAKREEDDGKDDSHSSAYVRVANWR
jgi:hypothetical protein